MPKRMQLYKFTAGAKEDLLALNSEYTPADIVGMLRDNIPCGKVVIKLRGNQITAITFDHLEKAARFYTFKCIICFDAKKI